MMNLKIIEKGTLFSEGMLIKHLILENEYLILDKHPSRDARVEAGYDLQGYDLQEEIRDRRINSRVINLECLKVTDLMKGRPEN